MPLKEMDYHHPFTPYPIQVDFMDAVFDCIENGKGKSLSLVCGSLTWLRENTATELVNNEKNHDGDEPEWVVQYAKNERKQAILARRQKIEARLAKIRVQEQAQRKHYESGEPSAKRMRTLGPSSENIVDNEESFVLDDYNSEDEKTKAQSVHNAAEGVSAATLALMKKAGMVVDHSMIEDEFEVEEATKIFYCSRTHSQLSQFANEVRRVHFPFILDDPASEHDPNAVVEEIKYLTLGSRKNLCINPRVSKLDSTVAINERCLELQKPKTSMEHKCEFLPNKENEPLVHEFRDHTLAKIRDIEDLAGLGKRVGICPYYASRATIKPSEIVTLPYPLLLQKSAREALKLSLKNHIVIIDEAHNLMDAISNIHSCQVSLSQLIRGRAQLSLYIKKFRNRLKGKNLIYVTQTFRLVDCLGKYLQRERKPGELLNVPEIMAGNGLDQINLHKLCNYLQESKLARKVDGYAAFAEEVTDNKQEKRAMSTPVLMQIQTFFQALANPATEGRFFYESVNAEEVGIRYMLLDPAHHFREIVEEARAVILAGGTMAPFDDYTSHLLPYLDPSRLKTLSCGHVIPVENMIALPVSQSIDGVSLDFTHQNLSAPDNFQKLVDSLGKLICDVLAHIPDGVVVFFPSYAILKKITQAWRVVSRPWKKGMWEQIHAHKQIIMESKESSNVDNVLTEYSGLIDEGKGAVLLAVIGGKMSEGINFSDRLGRGVIVVGLPFPNIHSAEWRAREQYIRQSTETKGGSAQEGMDMAREFTLNACMRAVNQSIGRAIRHREDYACIIMLDRRYNSPKIQKKLPGWIQRSLVKNAGEKCFSEVSGSIRQFFEAKKLAEGS